MQAVLRSKAAARSAPRLLWMATAFERLAHQPGAPAQVYDWKIERIEVQTAPLIDLFQSTHDRLYSRLFQS